MEIGTCPRCLHPYTVSEVVGYGVLRPRAAAAGGPRMEYACANCGRQIQLIPHGNGRYAPPGEPPPQVAPESARRPPWARDPASRAEPETAGAWDPGQHAHAGGAGPSPRQAQSQGPNSKGGASSDSKAESRSAGPESSVANEAAEEPMGPAEALKLLGVSPTAGADEIERAFRERSLTCHPDKVAHLDQDFQQLAERKFKRLRRALDILKA